MAIIYFFRIKELENNMVKTQKQLEDIQTSLNKLEEAEANEINIRDGYLTRYSNECVFNSIVGLNVSTSNGNMTIDHCKYVFLTENRGKLILNLQYELDIPETEKE